MAVVDDPFIEHSGLFKKVEHLVEDAVFGFRGLWIAVIALVTVFLGYHAVQIRPIAGFNKMVPQDHPYIENLRKHEADVPGGNDVQVIVESKTGDIFTRQYLQALKEISDAVFFLPGVERAGLESLWTKNVQWRAVTENGIEGGIVIPDTYDGSEESLQRVRQNVLRSGEVGRLVANDFRSSVIYTPLLEFDPLTGERPLDYREFSPLLEKIRDQYASDAVQVRVVGFAKLVGDLIDGIAIVGMFFAAVVLLTLVLLYGYSRSIRATIPPVATALVAVIWQLGILSLLGFGLDPFSILVPFLIFAIGVSHAVQNVNYMALAAGSGMGRVEASRESFRYVFGPGLTALVSDGAGFFTLFFIPVEIIQELAVAATVGIAALVLTKLVLLPLMMSYIGISPRGIERASHRISEIDVMSRLLGNFARPPWALVTIMVAAVFAAGASYLRQDLKIGDLDVGAPELRPDSRYNRDVAYLVDHYSSSSDVLVVMAETRGGECTAYRNMDAMNRFQWELEHVAGVQRTTSVVDGSKHTAALLNEGNVRWSALSRNQKALDSTIMYLPEGVYFNPECDLANIFVSLKDHKAETLGAVTTAVKKLRERYGSESIDYLLAAGNAGIEAATNELIESKQTFMLVLVYAVVTVMVLITFRNFGAVVCVMIPLVITSLLCEALMTVLGIGVKIATLPVTALGVGIGVDYGVYVYSRLEHYLHEGYPLMEAYRNTLLTAGKAVMFTGLTLAAGVLTWVLSPIKFQADMGLLLTFMFLWNMVGALTLLPALARYVVRHGGAGRTTGAAVAGSAA